MKKDRIFDVTPESYTTVHKGFFAFYAFLFFRWLIGMAKKIEVRREAEVRVQLAIALGIGVLIGLNWGNTMADTILITAFWFFVLVLAFIVISRNSEGWPGWLWLETAMAEIGKFINLIFDNSFIFPAGLFFLKAFFSSRDRCEECNKKRKVSVFFDSIGNPLILCDDCSKYLVEICLVEKEMTQ